LLPETLGSGCAFLDYDGDGWPDILFVNGMDWPGHTRARSTLRLYRNNRNGTFADVTKSAGLDVEIYGMGVAGGHWDHGSLARPPGHLGRPKPPVPKHRQGHVRRRDTGQRAGRPPGLQHVGDLGRRGSRRLARSVRLQLREVVGRTRRLLQSRRTAEVVLHA